MTRQSPDTRTPINVIPTARLPNETARAYSAFRVYAEMGENRSHTAVAKRYSIGIDLVRKWAQLHKWKVRLRTWQLEEHERTVNADQQAKNALALERERRRSVIEETAWELFEKVQEKVMEMLDFPLQTKSTTENGKTTVVRPAKWNFRDAVAMATTADTLARLGLGMPINRQEITGKNGAPLNPVAGPTIEIRRLSDAASAALIESAKPKMRAQEDRLGLN